MNRKTFQLGAWLMWLALPILALREGQVWNRLPARMATHFDLADHANGWMSREMSLGFDLGFMALMLAVFSMALWASQRKSSVGTFSWALLAFFYVQIGLIYLLLGQILDFNLHGTALNRVPLTVIATVAILILLAIYLGSQRGTSIPSGALIAEEVHTGGAWSLFLSIPLVALVWSISASAASGARILLACVSLILLAACGMAWSGFRYLFTSSGVEIRTLGFRLRTIPASDIEEYARDSWSMAGGYGIRGIGNRRAYVWGNRGVRIKTTNGEVFLGHSDPERIVHDLDAIRQAAH
jgi:hypothetical protein